MKGMKQLTPTPALATAGTTRKKQVTTAGACPMTGPEFDDLSFVADKVEKKEVSKRIIDIAFSTLAIIILSPLMIAIAILVRLVSPGGSLFRQTRIGRHGQEFQCLKFRTMHQNASTKSHSDYLNTLMSSDKPMTKLDQKGDPRVIPFGGILRATGLDELPQLFNVLKGEMSLVGPRPCTVSEYSLYTTWHKRRLSAKPGITGLWQVSGKNDTSFSEMIDLDVQYCENWDVGMDLSILSRTWQVVLKQLKQHLKMGGSQRQFS